MGLVLREAVFATITVVISYLIYVHPFAVLAHLLLGSPILSTPAMLLSVGIAAVVLFYLRTHNSSPLLGGFTHYGMGIGFISLWTSHLGLGLAALWPDYTVVIGFISLAATLILCLIAIIHGQSLTIKEVNLTSPKVSKVTRFIFISDVHLGSNPKAHLETIITKINDLDGEGLLIGGDLFDSSRFDPTDLAPLKSMKMPVLFVTGNHEYYVRDHKGKLAALSDYHIRHLDNEADKFLGLNLIGISDNLPASEQAEIAGRLIQPDRFNLVMVHQPAIWGRLPKQADLMLSGHTHNGQIFPFNILVRLQFKAVYGLYRHLFEDGAMNQLYVSSGSGCWGPRMRLGTRNEIVRISLHPEHSG